MPQDFELLPLSKNMSSNQSSADVLEQLLSSRHSCRAFTCEAVPSQTIERILDIAQRTASWTNAQPWQVIVTSGAGTERFRDVVLQSARYDEHAPDFSFPDAYPGVYNERRRECGLALYASVGISKGDRRASSLQAMENFRFFGAPHVAIITTEQALGVYGAVDVGAYAANFMLAAESLGISSIAQASLASRAQVVRKHFALPDSRFVVCGISFGFEDKAHPVNNFRTSRASLQEVVTWAN